MTTVTLATLMRDRDEGIASIRAPRARPLARAYARLRSVDARPILLALLAVATFVTRHGLVLAGCSAFVTAAAMISPIAGWAVAGLALFFLEARR